MLTWLWYSGTPLAWLLWPCSVLYRMASGVYSRLQAKSWKAPVPVIVVGNLTVGGTGKTPVVMALAHHYLSANRRVVILSRGYRGTALTEPRVVEPGSKPDECGDEPVLLAQQCRCPVVIDRRRARGARFAVGHLGAELLISDDGLQHKALGRDVELVVVDTSRGFGNGLLLPAGPLREGTSRLRNVTAVILNGHEACASIPPATLQFQVVLEPVGFVNLLTEEALSISEWKKRHAGESIHAVAGIGNPRRFFSTLEGLGFDIIPHEFPDHHPFQGDDLAFVPDATLVMTAKDAVKCKHFAKGHWWYLQAAVTLPAGLVATIDKLIGNPNAR